MSKEYLFSICIDFYDDLAHSSFDRRRLEDLFAFFQNWGMRRVYWMYTLRHHESPVFGHIPDPKRRANVRRTRESIGEFLPAAVEAAHKLGMECYATYKPFDLAFSHEFYPQGSADAKKHGKLDTLSGPIFRAADGLVRLKHRRLRRHPADLLSNGKRRVVAAMKITSDQWEQPPFTKEELGLLVSDDNRGYRPYSGPYAFRHEVVEGNRIIWLDGLDIAQPYLALESRIPERCDSFGGTLDQLITLYDRRGRAISFTYGLKTNGHGPASGKHPLRSANGFNFGEDVGADRTGFQLVTRHAINNRAMEGCTGFAIGKEPCIPGFLSPAYPEVRAYWLGHIRECLDAGVDGVDVRVQNHNKCLEWERYGFEQPVVRAFKDRYGADITKEPFDAARHRELLGGFYTGFLRSCGDLVRSRGKSMQVHIGPEEMIRAPHRHYMNLHWDWERWIEDALMDEITFKDRPLVDAALWDLVAPQARERAIPAYFCNRVTKGFAEPHFAKKWAQTLEDSIRLGQSGLMLYEAASHACVDQSGKVECRLPVIREILQQFRSKHRLR